MLVIDEEIWVAVAPSVAHQRLSEPARWRRAEIAGVERRVVVSSAPHLTWELTGRYQGHAEVAVSESGHGTTVRYQVRAQEIHGRDDAHVATRHIVAWKLVMWSIQ